MGRDPIEHGANKLPLDHDHHDHHHHVSNSTEQPPTNLPRRSVRSGAVVMVAQVITVGLGIGSMAVLGRLLTPADFGVVSITSAGPNFESRIRIPFITVFITTVKNALPTFVTFSVAHP